MFSTEKNFLLSWKRNFDIVKTYFFKCIPCYTFLQNKVDYTFLQNKVVWIAVKKNLNFSTPLIKKETWKFCLWHEHEAFKNLSCSIFMKIIPLKNSWKSQLDVSVSTDRETDYLWTWVHSVRSINRAWSCQTKSTVCISLSSTQIRNAVLKVNAVR